ncbi:MAG: hypothetical protein K0R66_605 [Gammaproteobacteria bacterium]|jgi:hypothetical protein|nr:hypothetical protein [Gammaproteobacteria bacterium]
MLSYSFRTQSDNLATCSGPELQQILKNSAINLSKLNSRFSNYRKWTNQALSLASFIMMLHPARVSFLPFINSIVSILFDKVASLCVGYKVARFKKIVQACILKQNLSEAMLRDLGEMMLMLNLPEAAKETLKEAFTLISAEAAVLSMQNHHHENLDWEVQAVA